MWEARCRAVLAWMTKLVLDAEPDVQRRLARLTVGPRREAAAGLLAAAVIGLAFCVVAMLAPWPFHAIRGPETVVRGGPRRVRAPAPPAFLTRRPARSGRHWPESHPGRRGGGCPDLDLGVAHAYCCRLKFHP